MKQAKTDSNTQRFPMRYAFYDRTNIQKFLEQKSEEGWMLQTYSNSTFIRTEPKKRHFSIVYYSDKAAKDQSPYERKQEFLEYCRHDGWELVTQNDRMMIFCNEQDSPTPIETDPRMEVENIHAAAKSYFWGECAFQLYFGIHWLRLFFQSITGDLAAFLSTCFLWIHLPMGCILSFIAIREITIYYRWYRAAKTAAADGLFWDTPTRSDISRITTTIQSVCLIFAILADDVLPYIAIGALVLVGLIFLVRWILKKCKVFNDILSGVTLLVAIPLFMILLLLSAFFLGGNATHSDLPLSICDLIEANPTNYTATLNKQSSFLVSQQTGKHRTADEHDDLPEIRYTVTTVHASFLYDACAKDLMEKQDYIATDAVPWDADKAYWDAQDHAYILFYENCIVEIKFTWEPTVEQMAIVGQKLGGE